MRSKTLLILIAISLLAGCRHDICPEPEPVVVHEYIYADCGTPPKRDPVDLRSLSWQVGAEGRFSLSAEGYEDLSYNISEIWNGVQQLTFEIGFYEACLRESTLPTSLPQQSPQE